MKIYLVRHGHTDLNARDIVQGTTNIDLNNHGEEQARMLGHALKKIVDTPKIHLHCSPLKRAKSTALIIKNIINPDLQIQTLDKLHEVNFGAFEGQDKETIKQKFPDFYNKEKNSFYTAFEQPFPEGESLKEVYIRLKPYCDQIKENGINNNTPYIIIAHGGINRMLRSHFLNEEPDNCIFEEHKHEEIRVFDLKNNQEKIYTCTS